MAIINCDMLDCEYNDDGFCVDDIIDLVAGECITYEHHDPTKDEMDLQFGLEE